MKRAWLACLPMLLLAAPAAVQGQSGYADGYNYSINSGDTNTITIVSCSASDGAVVIPTNINNLLVTVIGNGGFSPFAPAVTSVTIPASVTTLAASAFLATALGSVTIPGTVTCIGDDAFADCTNLASVTISNGVTSIGNGAFESCISLSNVTIPASVTSIGQGPFAYGISLTDIMVDPENLYYSSVNGVLFDYSQSTLIQYPAGVNGSYSIPAGVTGISADAFSHSGLTDVTIPDGVTNIGPYAFAFCGLTNVSIPASVANIGSNAFCFCTDLAGVTIANGVASIGEAAFQGTVLTNIMIPGSAAAIGPAAFFYCSSLTNVVIGDGVATMGSNAFDNCTSLASVTIASSVTSLGNGAFYDCTNLTMVTIPPGVTNLGDFAFGSRTKLAGIYFAGNAPSADLTVFYDDSPTAYYLPGTSGWSGFGVSTGLTPVLWNPQIQTSDGRFGVQGNQFGFNITGTNNFTVIIEATTNLANPVWTPVQSGTLVNGSFYFTDPQWSNYPARYYGLGLP